MLRRLAVILVILATLCPLAPPAAAQQKTRVVIVVAPGEALVLMREALDQAMHLHPGAGQFLLSYNDAPPWPRNVGASYFPPPRMVGDQVIVSRSEHRHYDADVVNGHVAILSEHDEHESTVASEAAVVEEDPPFTSLLVDAEDLVIIEAAWATLRDAYAETPPLGDLLVSYTRNATPGIGYDSNLTYVIFTRTGCPADSYSVFMNGNDDVRTYRGIVHQH